MAVKAYACVVLAAILAVSVSAAGQWRRGRATYYGDEPWLWDIHHGSCGYGYIWEDEPLGWDVAALPDVHYEYSGSCGNCYEVACDPSGFSDNYGNYLDRKHACHDSEASVVVRITDTCPCNYAGNSFSNKRWCCGDMDHFDLSVWAFEKLAPLRWGVVALKYRPVSCDHQPAKKAYAPNPSPGIPPPPGAKRPAWLTSINGPTKEQKKSVAKALWFGKSTQKGEVSVLMGGSMGSSWSSGSWHAQNAEDHSGAFGGVGVCKTLYPGGGIKLTTGQRGSFNGHTSMEMYVRGVYGPAEVSVSLVGHQGACQDIKLSGLTKSGNSNGYDRYDIYMGLFDTNRPQTVVAFADAFKGCGRNSADDVNSIYIKNTKNQQQQICVDGVKLK